MMLNKNWKTMACSPDSDTDMVIGVLQGDTLELYLFIICLDHVLRKSIDLMNEKGLKLKKARRKWYPTETITDANYLDDLALLANTLVQAESLLNSHEHAARDIDLYVNSDKANIICFKQGGIISTLNGKHQ